MSWIGLFRRGDQLVELRRNLLLDLRDNLFVGDCAA